MRTFLSRVVAGLAAVLAIAVPAADALAQTRIKDIASIRGVRSNQLVGYGLVIGLNGTGDSLRNAPFTEQAVQSMLDNMGINVRNANMRTRNIAAVVVTADLPAFSGKGSRIDVTVSSLGDASSLLGGTLVMTPLKGSDGEVYAVAQGPMTVSGFSAQGKAESVTQGVPTAGRIANGALVEREVANDFAERDSIILELRNADFSTAVRVADVINAFSKVNFQVNLAREKDFRTIRVRRPDRVPTARFLAALGELPVEPDMVARVVVDEKSGTIVMGQDVRISTVAVSQGNLSVRITEDEEVSQPAPFSKGRTVVTPLTSVQVRREKGRIAIVGGSSLEMLVKGLNAMALKPVDIIAILQAIKTTGALQAELVVQ